MAVAEGGAPGEEAANGLVECTEELEEWDSAMAIRRGMQRKRRIKNSRYHVRGNVPELLNRVNHHEFIHI